MWHSNCELQLTSQWSWLKCKFCKMAVCCWASSKNKCGHDIVSLCTFHFLFVPHRLGFWRWCEKSHFKNLSISTQWTHLNSIKPTPFSHIVQLKFHIFCEWMWCWCLFCGLLDVLDIPSASIWFLWTQDHLINTHLHITLHPFRKFHLGIMTGQTTVSFWFKYF